MKLECKESSVIPTIHINHTFKYHITILSVRFSLFMNTIIKSSTAKYEGSFRENNLLQLNKKLPTHMIQPAPESSLTIEEGKDKVF